MRNCIVCSSSTLELFNRFADSSGALAEGCCKPKQHLFKTSFEVLFCFATLHLKNDKMTEKETSIHIETVKSGSEEHNQRLKPLDYIREDLKHLNEEWTSDTISNRRSVLKKMVKEKTGRKLQEKASPIREGVVVIKQDTTLEDLRKFADRLEHRWGIKTFQIYTHKDEGYKNSNKWKPNLHAHMVFDWINHETGKSIKLSRGEYAEMQTILAETLGMKRGKSSEKKHLNSIQFKVQAEEKRLEERFELYQKLQEKANNLSSTAGELLKRIKPLENKINALESKKTEYQKQLNKLKIELQAHENAHNIINSEREKLERERKERQIGWREFLGEKGIKLSDSDIETLESSSGIGIEKKQQVQYNNAIWEKCTISRDEDYLLEISYDNKIRELPKQSQNRGMKI